DWLECLTPSRPVLITVDDADDLDEESLRVLAYAASSPRSGHVAVVCAAVERLRLLDRVHATTFELDDLDDVSARELLTHGGVAAPAVAAVVASVGGNPLALHHAGDVLAQSSQSSPGPDVGVVPLAPRLASHVGDRVAALDLPAQQLLAAVAVTG